jgi:hypothetical protein
MVPDEHANVPPEMTIMELLKEAFIAGASTGGTQWTGKLSIEGENRWVKFANQIQQKTSAAHLIAPSSAVAKQADDQELRAKLLWCAEQLDCEAAGAGDACREAIEVLSRPRANGQAWRDMASAPLNGKHCILAVKDGEFIWSVQGAYSYGEWNAVHRGNVKPLCWMPNVVPPREFMPPDFGRADET